MEYRTLGRSGLKISVLTFGTMTFGAESFFVKAGAADLSAATRQLDLCLDAGINIVDTANAYSTGRSEEVLGEALQGRRDRVLIATKARFSMGKGPNDEGLSRHHLIAQCEASLRRLRTDHIDLYQLHEWDGQTPIEETMEALDTLVKSGKIRYIGASNFSGWHLMKAMEAARANRYVPLVSQQIYYSLQSRDAENELVPVSIDQGLGILVWSPLAGGLLSGKYRRGQGTPEGTRHFQDWGEPPVHNQEQLYDTIEVLADIAQARGISAAEVALAWTLGRPAVTSLVIGARNEEQLKMNLRAASLKLSDEERARLDAVSQCPLQYPYWHQANTAAARLGEAELSLIRPHLTAGLKQRM
jgi:aryl-alcohol dehydrogenase-like predicted oxidoreductase